MSEVTTLKFIGVVEAIVGVIIIAFLIAIIKKNNERMKDGKLFDKIKNRDFVFNSRNYRDNRRVLGMYIESYIMYGYNVKCNMTDLEFRASLIWFVSCFSNCDNNKYGTLVYMLDTISTTLRKSGKCGDSSCIDRTSIVLEQIKKCYSEQMATENESENEHTELIKEIRMLMDAFNS